MSEIIWVVISILTWVIVPQLIVKWLDKHHAKKILKDFEGK